MCARRHTCGVVAVALLMLLGTGCATAKQSWRAGPLGIPAERSLRQQMDAGLFDAAWAALKTRQIAPADALLRHMYKGVVALHAGEFETGASAMDRAWTLAQDRWTKRISHAALSMVTSDAALPYYPGPAERMFIPYYGGLAWLARNERASAAVEARRLSTLLASDQGPQPSRQFRGVLRYVAGVMYEIAGERNDADVSYRNAAQLLGGALPGDTIPPDALHGDVVVLIEDGFVGRPEPQAYTYWYDDDELALLSSEEETRRYATVSILQHRRDDSRYDDRHWRDRNYRSVMLSWPGFDDSRRGTLALGARAVTGYEAGTVSTDVTSAVRADFERQQPMRLARAIARAAVRNAAMAAAGKSFENATKGDDKDDANDGKKKDKDGVKWGSILLGIGLFTVSATSAVLDQPDLRAWQLLPDRVTVARMRLPVGDHVIEVTRGGEAVSRGTVSVQPGSVTLLTHRWFTPARQTVAAEAVTPVPF